MEVKIEIDATEILPGVPNEEENISTEIRTTPDALKPSVKPESLSGSGQPAIRLQISKENSGVLSGKPATDAVQALVKKFKTHKCPMCDEHFLSLDLVNTHFLKYHSRPKFEKALEKPHKCPMCDERFLTLDLVNKHFVRYHSRPSQDLNSENASSFEMTINQEDPILQHPISRITKRPKFSCRDCSFIGKDKNDINKHRLNVHLTEKRFKCTICNYASNRSTSVKLHMLRVHSAIWWPKQVPFLL